MPDMKVERESYAKLKHLCANTPPTDPNFRNLMREKAAAFQREVREPKLAARKQAKAQARPDWLLRQSEEVQKKVREQGHP